ncbi:MAG TPA: iron dicitrate transport regulator FecR, partial [Candidatus Lambdaproteobacteria bacterium]|nr:iron dicitrate transport regulator FecR [Candidatus Lambdaproteobacteria bacterium]
VSGDIGEEKSVVDQIVRPLIGAFVSPLKEVPVEGLSRSELNSSCYYDVSVNKVGETLNLSISGHRTHTPFNGLSKSSRTFPENVRHSILRVLHNELNKSIKDEICSKYSEILVDECPQNQNLMIVFNKYSDSNLGNLMKEPRSNLVSGVVSLVETMESVDFIGISEIDFDHNFQYNLKRMMDKKGSNSSLVFTTEWDFQKQVTSMWKGFVSMTVSIESFSFKDGGLIKVGSYSIDPQRIPIRKWGDSSSFKKKQLQRITKKVSQKWSDSEMKNFIQSNN